jgi:UDP-GlcNAc:undecaprenyl-phosphate GlcNAc-1-phosphate transferase
VIGAAVLAFAGALVAGVTLRPIGLRIGAVDVPGDLKPHASPTPYLGGVAVAVGLAAGLAVKGWPLPWAATVVLACALLLGLADDRLHVQAFVRLGVQLGLGVLLAAGGFAADALPGTVLAWVGAIALLAASINAVNMVDGMDGLAGSAASLTAAGLAVIAARAGHGSPELVGLLIAAATLGFVAHNLPPARLFLGDNGSYLLGAALAIAVLAEGRTVPRLLGAATCLGVFLLDLVLAILRRAAGRASLTEGDRSHLYDQLQERGMSAAGTLAAVLLAHVAMIAAGVQTARLTTGAAVVTTVVLWAIALGWLLWSGFVTRPDAV